VQTSVRPPPSLRPPGRSRAQLRDQQTLLSTALRVGFGGPAAGLPGAARAVLDVLPPHLQVYLPQALQHLPADLRLVLRLVIVYDCARSDVAKTFGCCEQTVSTRLDCALTRLARLLWDDAGHALAVAPPRRRWSQSGC
jgi:DNA-directed RNA polymerase specialized sigma24 family protein